MSSVVETMNAMKDVEEFKSCLIRSQVIKSYSQAVLKASPNTTITEKSLKKAVQKAVSEEDRSRNVLIFGLKETDEEKLHFEAVRIGRKSADKTRPVKMLFEYCSSDFIKIEGPATKSAPQNCVHFSRSVT